jgi:hypothetical protein
MNLSELIDAMRPGSKNPDEERSKKDLGRFGLGLKSASFSQCKRLTVVTRKENHHVIKRCWDVDYVNAKNSWILLDYISDKTLLDRYNEKTGTLVIWESLDKLGLKEEDSKEDEISKGNFYKNISFLRSHLGLVFHKFIESNKLKIEINGNKVLPQNPFLLNLSVKPNMLPIENLGDVIVKAYILPHMSKISSEELESSGGGLGWLNNQGFYVYRQDRLIVGATWLDLDTNSLKKMEFSKLVRIEVSIQNVDDFDWKLDIKKSNTVPPKYLQGDLLRIAKSAISQSAKVYKYKSEKLIKSLTSEKAIVRLWYDELSSDRIFKKYRLNLDHPVIKNIIDDVTDKNAIKSCLKMIEESIPIEQIIFNQSENPSFHESKVTEIIPQAFIVNAAKNIYKDLISKGMTVKDAKVEILHMIPFNQYPIIETYL